MIVFLHILVLIILFYRTSFLKIKGVPGWYLPCLLLLKVAGGFFIANYYMSTYQGGDMQGYMADTVAFYNLFLENPMLFFKMMLGMENESTQLFINNLTIWPDNGYGFLFNDARTVVRFHALLSIFSGTNEWVHLLWSNVLSIMGMNALLQFIFSSRGKKPIIPHAAFLVFFLPNVFIWSSTILKEPLLLFAMGMTLRYFQLWNNNRRPIYLVGLLLFTGCFVLIKSFWLLVFLPGFFIWMFKRDMNKPLQTMSITYFVTLVLVLVGGIFFPVLDVPALLFGQQLNMWRFAVFMHAGSLVHTVSFAPTITSFLLHIPDAFSFALFQPWPCQLAKWYHFPLFLENLIFPLIFFLALYFAWRKREMPSAEVVLAAIAGIIILVVCGFTTPVIGSLIRFRMPGLLLLILAFYSWHYFSSKSNISKKEGN
ncbi:MAG: hypothetical protein IPN36_12735 [Bacteroidetes bacterium]|nr:hypothetical protein [Bacteroidota bacterium]